MRGPWLRTPHCWCALQVVGQHGEVLGTIIYSIGTQRPVPASQQRTQPQPQPQTQQAGSTLPAAVRDDDSTESSSAGHIQTASLGGQSQTAFHAAAAADALSDATASQDSTALTAVSTHRRTTASMGVPVGYGPQGTEALQSSLDDHRRNDDGGAESLIPSSSAPLPDTNLSFANDSPVFGIDACPVKFASLTFLTTPSQVLRALLKIDCYLEPLHE